MFLLMLGDRATVVHKAQYTCQSADRSMSALYVP